jgi:pimeloyl-ACP methyl ester carboxylesterase
MANQHTVFRSTEGEAEYTAAYNSALARWPIPYQELSIPTRLGPAHVIACGPINAPPLVLLHGQGLSALSWSACIPALTEHYRVYAPDNVNDLGKTSMTRMVQGRSDFYVWLVDLLDGLKLKDPAVAGHCFGGWMGMTLALLAPKRVSRLVVLAPQAAFSRSILLGYPFWFLYRYVQLKLRPSHERALKLARWITSPACPVQGLSYDALVDAIFQYSPPRTILASAFTDDELRCIKTPTLLLTGENEIFYSPQQAAARAARLMPAVHTEMMPGCGHALILEQPQPAARRMLEFLAA